PNIDLFTVGSVFHHPDVGGGAQINLGGGNNTATILLNNVSPAFTVNSSSKGVETSTINLFAENVFGDVSASLGNGATTNFTFNGTTVFGNFKVNTGAKSQTTNINVNVNNKVTKSVTVNNFGRDTMTTLTTATIFGNVNLKSMGTTSSTVTLTAI